MLRLLSLVIDTGERLLLLLLALMEHGSRHGARIHAPQVFRRRVKRRMRSEHVQAEHPGCAQTAPDEVSRAFGAPGYLVVFSGHTGLKHIRISFDFHGLIELRPAHAALLQPALVGMCCNRPGRLGFRVMAPFKEPVTVLAARLHTFPRTRQMELADQAAIISCFG